MTDPVDRRPPSALVRRRVVVRGRVQGVWFRDSCQRRAHEHGVAGWVRNREDGSVEAVFEGDERDVGAMVEWCRHGPSRARVDAVEVSTEDPEGETCFSVR